MNRVLEVSEAEDVTGNQYSLAITAPDRVTFVKGTCREESRWWFDVLSVFPTAQKVSRPLYLKRKYYCSFMQFFVLGQFFIERA